MKALTLTQPWATLVATGAKLIETRSWYTAYRGPLAIHAARTIPPNVRKYLGWSVEPFASALKGLFWDSRSVTMNLFGQSGPGTSYQLYPNNFHLGRVLCTCNLVDCKYIDVSIADPNTTPSILVGGLLWVLTPKERAFGDYHEGRWMWLLDDIQPLPEPVAARGALKLWDWQEA